MNSEPEISIVGGGLDSSMHLSVEACRAIRNSKVVFHGGCHERVHRWLADLARDSQVVDINIGHYQMGQYRPDIYRSMAAKVVEAARAFGAVALIEPGSAMVTDLVTRFVLDGAACAGIRTTIVPGISSLEHICVEFGIDPADGLQAILAQELVARRIELSKQLDTVVIQPGYFDTLWCAGWPRSRSTRFDALVAALALTFEPQQIMALVRFPMHPGDATHQFWFNFRDLQRLEPLITPLHTLFIPSSEKGARDPLFEARMHTWERTVQFLDTGTDGLPLQFAPIASNQDLHKVERELDEDLRLSSHQLSATWRAQAIARAIRRIESGTAPA
jgi:precorrin-2 methylase